MNAIEIGLILTACILILIAIGIPIGISLGLTGFIGVFLLVSGNAAIAKISLVPYQIITSYDYATLPLYIFMAQICFSMGLGHSLYNLASKWLGRLPGGLAVATIGACAGFSAVSASSVATATTIGLIAIPEMKKYGYSSALITGSVVTGGTLGPLIPPSGLFIYYGILTETSISKLFIAGIIPGIILTVFYIIAISIICTHNPAEGPRGPISTLKEKIWAFKDCWEVIVLILLVLGGLTVGWFTPTESGAIGAFGAIIVSIFRKKLTWSDLKSASTETLKTTGMIYLILIGAILFSPAMALSNLPSELANFITQLNTSPTLVMIFIIALYVILGTFMDEAALMFITVPIIFPVVFGLGFDPIWFGVMVVVLMMTATISPPLGINMYVVSSIAKDVPMTTIYRGTIPFMAVNIVFIFMLLFIPQIALFLPGLTK